MTIPAANVQIEWNDQDRSKLSEVVVFDRTTVTPEDMDRLGRHYISSSGACNGDWLKGRGQATPEGIFIDWARDGFASDEAMLQALDQLSQIEGCDWALVMARALREGIEQRTGEAAPSVEDTLPRVRPR